jgi:hypothetical protein
MVMKAVYACEELDGIQSTPWHYNKALLLSSDGVYISLTCQDTEDRCRSHSIIVDVQSKKRLGQVDARFGPWRRT